ncbi:cell division protein [Stylonychia lemnae]|uniref:Cell division protein n=1 Tax=Stylonychia lemnae TaxID=5949 RepID=A0A078AMD1_STYLE|nr:cell division protein [Stylonychia lemnae]|eukprot:CDW82547.1 cell division protein [Stylonychia lemnae]
MQQNKFAGEENNSKYSNPLFQNFVDFEGKNELKPAQRNSSLNSANSNNEQFLNQNQNQNLSAALGLMFNRGNINREEEEKFQQLEVSKALKGFDENEGSQLAHLGRGLMNEDQKTISKDLKNISKKNKQQKLQQKIDMDHTGSFFDRNQDVKLKINQLTPKKKQNSSRQQSFKDPDYQDHQHLMTIKEETKISKEFEVDDDFFKVKMSSIKVSDDYVHIEQQKELFREFMHPQGKEQDASIIQDRQKSIQASERQNQVLTDNRSIYNEQISQGISTSKSKSKGKKILEFNNTPLKSRRQRIYSDTDAFQGNNQPQSFPITNKTQLKDKTFHNAETRNAKLRINMGQLSNEDYIQQNYTDQEQPYKFHRNLQLALAGDTFPDQFNTLKKTRLGSFNQQLSPRQRDDIIRQINERGIDRNDLMRDTGTVDFIVEDHSNEESKQPSPQMNRSLDGNDLNQNSNNIYGEIAESKLLSETHIREDIQQKIQCQMNEGYEEDLEDTKDDNQDQNSQIFQQNLTQVFDPLLETAYDFTQPTNTSKSKYLNIMVCGPAGIGKSSFIELFLEKFNKVQFQELISKRSNNKNKKPQPTQLEGFLKEQTNIYAPKIVITGTIEEYEISKSINGREVCLKMIDSVGYGNSMELSSWRKHIQDYIKGNLINYQTQVDEIEQMYLKEHQNKMKKLKDIKDNRVHLLLYFFGGHHTNAVDFKILSRLKKYVNILPIIPKADSFNSEELFNMKTDIIINGQDRDIMFFDCIEAISQAVGQNEEKMKLLTEELLNTGYSKGSTTHSCPPFAIINPSDSIQIKNNQGQYEIRYGRKMNWGFCDAFDDRNADFSRLYKLIISNYHVHFIVFIDILWDQLVTITTFIMEDYSKKRDERKKKKIVHEKQVKKYSILTGIAALGGAAIMALKYSKQ